MDTESEGTPTPPLVVTDGGAESPPLTLGPRRLHYGFSVALPQAHLTFISIVQGIAFGILLQNWPLPTDLRSPHLWAFLVSHHAFLPWIVSVLLIVMIWHEFAVISVFYIWPLSSSQTGLILLLSLAEIIAFRTIPNFGFWLLSLGLVGIIGGLIRLNNLRTLVASSYDNLAMKRHDDRIEQRDGIVYGVLGFVVFVVGMAFVSNVLPSPDWLQWLLLVVLTGLFVVLLLSGEGALTTLISDAAAGSDLEANGIGGLKYKRKASE